MHIHELCAKGEPLGRIMVAGDKTYAAALSSQHSQKLIQQRHSLRRRHSLVVHISGNQHVVHRLTCCNGSNLVEDIGLIFQQRNVTQTLSQMQIGQMQQFHCLLLPFVFMHLIIADFWPEEQKKLFPSRRPLQAKGPLL